MSVAEAKQSDNSSISAEQGVIVPFQSLDPDRVDAEQYPALPAADEARRVMLAPARPTR